MAATIHDVAKLAGVNPSTVSRALSGKAVITEETREKIYAAMRELDYHPNSVARSLASGLSGAIGVVVDAQDADAFSNVFFSRSLFAIEKVAQSRGYHVIIANGAKRAGGASSIEGLMLERKVDGLILPPSTLKSALLEKIEGFPYVVLGQPDTARRGLSWVDVNNEQGGAMAVEHLRQMGYARIAYLGGGGRTGFVKRRVKGYLSVLVRETEALVLSTDGTAEDARRAAHEALRAEIRPDAFLCNDNLAAFGLLKAAKALGLRVPDELGVATFDNYPLAEFTDPPLTAVDVDTALLGEQTARLLFQKINRQTADQQVLLCTSLIERESSRRM